MWNFGAMRGGNKMKTKIGLEFEIDFAHTLKGHYKCSQPHGHTSKIHVEVVGEVKTGSTYIENMVMDFADMKKTCWDVIGQLDHKNLNTLFEFPTSENIAMWIFKNLEGKLPISTVKFYEGNGKWCMIEK
jgi:queuosine biosynthesis protein QueD